MGVGVLTGFFGVGGGFLIVPALVLVLGLPMREAVGTSLLIIALTATGGLAGHLGAGGLSVPLVVAFAAAGVAGSLSGVALGRRVPTRSLSRAFALTLVGVAVALMAVTRGPPLRRWLAAVTAGEAAGFAIAAAAGAAAWGLAPGTGRWCP